VLVLVEAQVHDRHRRDLRELHEDRLVVAAERAVALVGEVQKPGVAAGAVDERHRQPARGSGGRVDTRPGRVLLELPLVEPRQLAALADPLVKRRHPVVLAALDRLIRLSDGVADETALPTARQARHGPARADDLERVQRDELGELLDRARRGDRQGSVCQPAQLATVLLLEPRSLLRLTEAALGHLEGGEALHRELRGGRGRACVLLSRGR